MTAVRAGIIYGAAVFLTGAILGTLRVLLLVPRLGETASVALEVPLMLLTAWGICGMVIARLAVPLRVRPRLVMGSTALMLVWLAEAMLASALGAPPLFAGWKTPAGLLGLAAQGVFAGFPLLRAIRWP